MNCRRLMISVVVVLTLGPTARAGIFTTQIGFTPYFANETLFNGPDSLTVVNFTETDPNHAGYLFQGDASASGAFMMGGPVLRGTALLSATMVPYLSPSQHPFFPMRVQSIVNYNDMPTVTSPTVPIGDPIMVSTTYTITGFFDPGPGGPNILATSGGATVFQNAPGFNFGGAPAFTNTFTVSNGVPFAYSLSLFVAVVGPTSVPSDFPDFFITSGTADFGHSMVLTDLSFQDSNGMPISATMLTDDGMTYSGSASSVPEPASMVLLGVGSMVAWMSRFRTQRGARTWARWWCLRFKGSGESSWNA